LPTSGRTLAHDAAGTAAPRRCFLDRRVRDGLTCGDVKIQLSGPR